MPKLMRNKEQRGIIWKRNVNNDGVNDANKSGGQNEKRTATQVNKGISEMNKFEVLKEMNANEDSEVRTLKDRMLKEKEYQSKNVEDEFDNEDGIAQTMTGDNVIGLMLKEKEYQSKNVEDEFDNEDGIAQTMTGDNVIGLSSKRKELWRDNMRAKMIKSGWPWLMTSDFNVTLKNEEHSNGGSRISNDMQDFIDCVNEAEMKDLCSNGVFYTWIKSPLNPHNSVLKKLDRAMVNEDLILKFPDANALFLPYLVSDHSPVVVRFPSSYEKKKKAFRFANFIAEKVDFLLTVATNWEVEVQGYKMYQLVKKMKALKYNLNAVSWKNGNLSKNVEKYRNELKIAQTNLDNHPHNQDTKEKEVNALKEYNEASNDEESFLFRKAKVDWICWKEVTDFEIKNALFDIGDNQDESILLLKGIIRMNVIKVLGDGKSTNVWFDHWSSVGILSVKTKRGECNPRLAFILWMAVRRKLQTQDRVMAWNNNNDMKCPLCKMVNDSHNHLFFECDYSRKIWEDLKENMENRDLSNSWDILVDQNARLFTGEVKDDRYCAQNILVDQYAGSVCYNSIGSILRRIMLKIVVENVKLQLSSLKVEKSCNVEKVASKWNVR
ncbi:RNA-directed DNA polymerase, eukaryota, reverse transcriptase zinc-binding domain protein [Tanacetum coccineum]